MKVILLEDVKSIGKRERSLKLAMAMQRIFCLRKSWALKQQQTIGTT